MGTHPITFFLLNKNELTYEVLIRGEDPGSTVLELRKQINKLTPLYPSDDIQESGIDFDTDFEGVICSLKELNSRIQNLESKYDANVYKRTTALSNHIYYRLKRMKPTLTDSSEKLNSIVKEYKNYFAKLNKISSQKTTSSDSSECAQLPSNIDMSSIISLSCNNNHINDLCKIKYDGTTCVRAFLQKINEFRVGRNISSTRLFTSASEIFSGDALHWYRSVKDKVNDWDQLSELLTKDFGQFDYDYRLMSEIRNRTQGENENITIYLAIMSELFSRLSNSLTETEKLNILLHNIRPCYANVLASTSSGIQTIDTLRTLCRNYENIQCMTSQFHEPPKITTKTLAPDLAYTKQDSSSNQHPNYYHKHYNLHKNYTNNNHVYNNKYNSSNTTNPNKNYINKNNFNPKHANPNKQYYSNYAHRNTTVDKTPVASVGNCNNVVTNKTPYCPRCRSNDHSLHQCERERFPICFKCGTKDVKYPDCPKCHSSSNQKN